MSSVPRCYKQGKRLELSQFCTGVCEDRIWTRKVEEAPLLEAVAGNGWWRHSKLEKCLAGAMVICELWRLAVAL
jgi:hypothetical protein